MTTGAETKQRKHDMPRRARRVGCEQIPDLSVAVTRPQGYFSATDGKDLPVPYRPDVSIE